ncbi:MAG: glycosyltransferase family 39 protein [Deltaproteobacteria bacterium]|nr:glycosyltransferase family 39 protein [Deltaproteobacteria bacterium]
MAAERRALDGWAVAAVALGVRLLVVWWAWGRFPPTADGSYYHQLATRLAGGHGYTWLWPDGAVTFAAHYPIGYPAAVAGIYGAFGPAPGLAMVLNAVVGAIGCVAVHQLVAHFRHRRLALAAGLLVALHPGLVGYTPALMTEGVAASVVACAVWAATVVRSTPVGRRRWLWLTLCGVLLGVATLVRPQCLVLAPVLGVVAWGSRRGLGRALVAGALVTALALAVCAPWTARNCQRMGRCALVSVNGGWNLLIGTDPAGRGGWAPLKTPAECREVFDEAGKDECFEGAAWRAIVAAPGAWLALVPQKLSVTFDYCGAAGWYLHEANPQAFDARAKAVLGIVETAWERLVLVLATLSLWPRRMGKRGGRAAAGWALRALVLLGVGFALSRHGWVAYLALLAALCLRRPGLLRAPPILGGVLATLICVTAVHAVFFGAGRYQLLLLPVLCALAALGLGRLRTLGRDAARLVQR